MKYKLIGIYVLILFIYYLVSFYIIQDIIVPDIIGGIGNQLFIVSSAYAYSKKFNKKLIMLNRNEIFSYGGNRNNNNNNIFYNIPKKNIDINKLNKLKEDEYYKYKKGSLYLTERYYQDYNYFNNYKNDLINLFKPNIEIQKVLDELKIKYNITSSDKNICVHIRLVDKFTPNNHDGLYSDSEIQDISKKLDNLKGNKLIFSNDINKCKQLLKNKDLIYVSEKDYLELYLISYCNYYIASPSTFNWWGIYLNKDKFEIYISWNKDSEYRKDFYNKYKCFNII